MTYNNHPIPHILFSGSSKSLCFFSKRSIKKNCSTGTCFGSGWVSKGTPGRIRTHNLGVRSALLYPFEPLGHCFTIIASGYFSIKIRKLTAGGCRRSKGGIPTSHPFRDFTTQGGMRCKLFWR